MSFVKMVVIQNTDIFFVYNKPKKFLAELFAFYQALKTLGRCKSNNFPNINGKIVRHAGLFNFGLATGLGRRKTRNLNQLKSN